MVKLSLIDTDNSVLIRLSAWASWSFFDLLGYFAAHCPAVENHDGTGLVIGMLFSQVPWEKKV